MNALKKVIKYLLYGGAVACCFAGIWVIYVAIANFREMPFPQWFVVLIVEVIFTCLAFTPALMLLKRFKTKMWHWLVIGIVEVLVIAVTAFALFAFLALLEP
ncbi:MAG TPA: hypothetical protein VGY98_16540 [Verrucomicrobiae bacterium]|nr:hypothetical protein [Verrucomicrobiae bacterium]